jgi:CDP-paratose 2-epimerase
VLANIETVKGRAFNLGGGPGNAVSLKAVLGEIDALSGGALPLAYGDWRKGDQSYFVADTRALEAELGWRAEVGWREGLRRLHAWLKDSRAAERPSAAPRRAIA